MIAVLKKGASEQSVSHLVSWIQKKGLDTHIRDVYKRQDLRWYQKQPPLPPWRHWHSARNPSRAMTP